MNSYMNTTFKIENSLDELLNSLGFERWEEYLNKFVLPPLNMLGVLTSSISAWILFKRNTFTDPIFLYFRIISLFYAFISLINIPSLLCFSPRFYPSKILHLTYACSAYQVFYFSIIAFLIHFCSVLDICILLNRMKIFNATIARRFSLSPKIVCLLFFVVCLVINLPLDFTFKIKSLGNYSYFDSEGVMRNATLYYYGSTSFALSSLGIVISDINYLTSIVFTLIVCVVLNIISVLQYKSYLRQKRQRVEEMRMKSSRPASDIQDIQKERRERRAENKMLYMALTLSSISVLYRVVVTLCYIYVFKLKSFSSTLILVSFCYIMYTFITFTSIFIFYYFNNLFRQEFRRIFSLQRMASISNQNNQYPIITHEDLAYN